MDASNKSETSWNFLNYNIFFKNKNINIYYKIIMKIKKNEKPHASKNILKNYYKNNKKTYFLLFLF